jgi:DNA (cytosine-5)-methyltransferase 1
MKKSYVTVTDQFCGAGGSSLGAVAAGAEVRLALNHWRLAIETHNHNFPDTLHDCTDISACDPRRYPSTDILITSPECTNHSIAKGKKRAGQKQLSFDWFDGKQQLDPAAERSRATMWDVPRFAEYHHYNLIIVENVVDARLWVMWDAWLHAMDSLGYNHKAVYLNSMHAWPTPQSRDRMYVVFWKKGNRAPNLDFTPQAYCQRCEKNVQSIQSWKIPSRPYGKYKQQYVYLCPECACKVEPYYYCAANAIDWGLSVERIGDRKKPLKPKTMARIEAGLKKFARTGFMVETAFSHAPDNRFKGMDEPYPTQASRQSLGLAVPPALLMGLGGATGSRRDVEMSDVIPTQTGTRQFGLAVPPFLMGNYTPGVHYPIDGTLGTVTTQDHHSLVVPPFLTFPNQTGDHRTRDVSQPYPTQTASLDPALVMPPFIVEMRRDFSLSPTTNPLATVVASAFHHWLIMPFLTSYYGNDNGHSVLEAAGTVTTVDRHALVSPTETIQAADCGFRMLQPHEIGRAMAFPDTYVVKGNNRERVKQLGNAVTPPAMTALFERCLETLAS